MGTMEMKYFRHKLTGKVDLFPAHFADYTDIMEEVDSNDAVCGDCGLEPTFLEPPVRVFDTEDALEEELEEEEYGD